MPPTALGLVLVAAILHAGWNLFVKRARQKQIFTWWALLVGVVCFSPLLLMSLRFPMQIWFYAVCSGLVEAAYYIALTRAYDKADFSLVYPLARGSAPAFLAIWAILFLGERPRPGGYIGLALLVFGLVVVGGGSLWALRKIAVVTTSGVGIAIGVAICISIYSVIDGAAVHLTAPMPYTVLVIGLSTLFISPIMLLPYGREAIVAEWHTHWLLIIVAGILMLLSYMLVLQAYSIARVSYAGAIREISVIFAALIGWHWLREDFGAMRTVGAILIFIGILIIAIFG